VVGLKQRRRKSLGERLNSDESQSVAAMHAIQPHRHFRGMERHDDETLKVCRRMQW